MYTVLILIIIAASVFLLFNGIKKKNKGIVAGGIAIAVGGYLFFWLMDFWGEMLWFKNLTFISRFWTFELTRLTFIIGGFIIGYLIILAITFSVRSLRKFYRTYASIIGGFAGIVFLNNNKLRLFLNI